MAEIEARWQHLPDGFHGQRKLIKVHSGAVTVLLSPARRKNI
jgi:hypothetical protein